MEVRVLGPAEVLSAGRPVDLGTRKQRALLAALSLHVGRPVAVDTIVDLLWGDEPPPGVTGTLQAYVAGLRRALEPSRERRAPAALLVTVAPGYALRLQPDQLDATRFSRAVSSLHARLATVSALVPSRPPRVSGADLGEVVAELDGALALWRGEPYAELGDAADARAERVRLEELQLLAVEDRALANLWLGHGGTVAAELEGLTAAHPLRERLWGLRALALARTGRQADALEVLRLVRTVLDDELGLEPGAELRSLQTAVLRQDEALQWQPADAVPWRAEPRLADGHLSSADPRRAADAGDVQPGTAPAGWAMVGRERQLSTLVRLLSGVGSGPAFASVVGEPGIGKTRLAGELISHARSQGVTVLTGRCSQDDGAPPLWPWASVLAGLAQALPAGDDEGQLTEFAAWDGIVRQVLQAARDQTVLIVLDDLHWADASSLRALRLLVETPDTGAESGSARLMVLLTWRSHPPPSGPLADLVEVLARRHATRLELSGLSSAEAAEVVRTVSETAPTAAEASALRDRTDGNPFFLVEYARLAGERGGLEQLLAEEDRPTAVRDVLVRRLGRLPEDTCAALRVAAVVGRQFDLGTLTTASGTDEDALLDALEPAMAAGLVREDGIDRFTFAHALVRDTAYGEMSASRRARLHARVAFALEGAVGRETEVAHHWFAAGPVHAAKAWPAAVAAAAQARRVHAHQESAELLATALRTMSAEAGAEPLDRYEILMQLIDAYRWAARWPDLVRSVEAAIVVAEEIGDVELVAQAAMSTTISVLWQSAPDGQVHAGIVTALRRCLAQLPTSDSPTRCRVMLSLANELYYGATFEERSALVEEALAMAERLGDDRLLLDANQIAFSAVWCPRTAEARLVYAGRAMELATALGQEQAFVVSATLRAVVEGELGLVDQMWASAATARAEAERLRIPYGLLVLDNLALPWRAMAGRFDECEMLLEHVDQLDQQMSLEDQGEARAEAMIPLRLWQGRGEELLPTLLAMEQGPLPMTSLVLLVQLRTGQREEAEHHHAQHPVDLSGNDWFAMLNWCAAAEVACALQDRSLAARAYAALAGFTGRCCTAGSALAMGPVDAFLALAAVAVGERELAGRHADCALELAEAWQIPLAAAWLGDQRERFGF